MPSTIPIAIIGCGAIGEEHARCLGSLPGASLRAFCDLYESRAAALANLHPGSYYTTHPARILADDSIEAVYICTHTDSHAPLGIAAAKARKHIMMEKPLALTESECYAVAEAVEQAGIFCMTAFKLRFYSAVRKVRQFIPAPTVAVGQMMDERWPPEFWANDPLKGGGNVLSQGCHSVDLLFHLVGAEPVRVYAEGGTLHHQGSSITDTLLATIQFANGAVGSLVQGDAGRIPLLSKFSFQVMDGVRTAHLYNRLMTAVFWDGKQSHRYDVDHEEGMMEENRAFLTALKERTTPPVGVRDGVRATLVLLRAIESLTTHKPQTIRM
jgi:myo-inositol 2-dehydrogenase / D-chiro-inositol 1-dehydrogenase